MSSSNNSTSTFTRIPELLVDRRSRGSKVEYLVQWKGVGKDGNTWENFKSLSSCSNLIRQFEKGWEASQRYFMAGAKSSRKRVESPKREKARAGPITRSASSSAAAVARVKAKASVVATSDAGPVSKVPEPTVSQGGPADKKRRRTRATPTPKPPSDEKNRKRVRSPGTEFKDKNKDVNKSGRCQMRSVRPETANRNAEGVVRIQNRGRSTIPKCDEPPRVRKRARFNEASPFFRHLDQQPLNTANIRAADLQRHVAWPNVHISPLPN